MSTLHVYGDSFSVDESQLNSPSWSRQVSGLLNLLLHNRAISGSSTEYAFSWLVQDLKDNRIKPSDVVIFQFSTSVRLHFEHQLWHRPETASQYLTPVDETDPKHQWYVDNKAHIQWYLRNINFNIFELNQESYLHSIRAIAENNPSNLFLIMFNSEPYSNLPKFTPPENMLITDISLNRLSFLEQLKDYTYQEWAEYTGRDYRINHLTNPNLHILANLIANSITFKSLVGWSLDLFHKGLIDKVSNKAQYMEYVHANLIPYYESIHKDLPNL